MRVASDLEILRQRFEEWSAIHEIEEKNHRQKVLMALQQLLSPSPVRQPMHLPAGNLQPAPPWARCVYVDNTGNSTSARISLGFVNFIVPAAAGEWLVVAGSDAIRSTESVNLLFSSDVRDVAASGSEIVQVSGSLPAGTNLIGSTYIQLAGGGLWDSVQAAGDGILGGAVGWIGTSAYNGNTYDRVYNNTQGTLLASATRTTTTTSPIMSNFNARGIHVQLNITGIPSSPSTGTGLSVVVRGYDGDGNAYNLNTAPSNVTAGGEYVYIVYPASSGTTGQIQQSTSQALPRTWDVVVVVSTSDSYTYALNYSLIN